VRRSSPVFTARALSELRAIRRWIATANGDERADHMIERIAVAAGLLSERPLIGRERPEISPGLRSFAVSPYVIFYRPLTDGARVMRVVHGHQDTNRVFRKREEGEP
jgi:toxin ParE1/3/4